MYRAIVEWAEHTHVPVVFGTDHLVERLIDLAPHTRVLYPPTSEETAKEVALVMLGQPQPPAPNPMELQARQVVIQQADQVIVYTTGGEAGV